jgi:hypothetical protein
MNENEQATQRAAGPTKKQDNEGYFIERLKYQGFGNLLSQPLRDALKEGKDEFKLTFVGESFGHFGKMRIVDYELNFRKDKQQKDEKGQPLHYFNSMKATLRDGQDPSQNRSHLFYMQNDRGVTSKEAMNLLEGRAVKKTVNKEKKDAQGNVIRTPGQRPETEDVWLQLDVNKRKNENEFEMHAYSEKYKYDLNKAISRFDIKGMDYAASKVSILKSLENGNPTPVVFAGKENAAGFLVANPKDRNVLAFDSNWQSFGHGMRQHTGERTERSENNSKSESLDQGRGNTSTTASRNESASDDRIKNKENGAAQSTVAENSKAEQNGKKQSEDVTTKNSQGQEAGKKKSRSIGV